MALSVNQLGMSLMRMGAESDTVRFLDDVNLTFSLDSRASQREHVSIESSSTEVVFRASYRDIMLITTIATKAIELYAKSLGSTVSDGKQPSNAQTGAARSASMTATRRTLPNAQIVMSKEQV